MVLVAALVVVVVLFVVALFPSKKRDGQTQSVDPSRLFQSHPARTATLREQQLEEEAAAIASEYQQRANAVWLSELRAKGTKLLGGAKSKADE